MTLTVLGTSAPGPLPDRPCSGYLLEAGRTRVWVDAGPGSLANLRRHVRLDGLDAVWVSHLHADHCADLISAFYALRYGGLSAPGPIPVYAPARYAERLAGFFGRPDTEFLRDTFDFRPLHDGHRTELGGLVLTSREVLHDVEAYALRAEYEGRTLVYSGDSGPCPALDEVASGADLLLCEADSDSLPENEPQVHLTPEDAGALARRAGAGELLVTHVGPFLTPERAVERAGAALGRPAQVAREGDTHVV